MPPVTLNDFTRLANQASPAAQDKTFLKVKDGRLTETGRLGNFFTRSSDRRAAIDAFVGALRQQYGPHIADMINNDGLSGLRRAGRPLTARLVTDLVRRAEEEKARVNEHNLQVVLDFLTGEGENPEMRLGNAVDTYCARCGLNAREDKDLVWERVARSLHDRAKNGDFHPNILTPEALQARAIRRYAGLSESHISAIALSDLNLPNNTLADRLRLADLGLGGRHAVTFTRCFQALERMREIQPAGDLTLETAHQALFGEAPPEGLSGDGLLEHIETRCGNDMQRLLRSIGGEEAEEIKILNYSKLAPWASLASLVVRPNIVTLDDVPGVRAYFQSPPSLSEAQAQLRVDPPRQNQGAVMEPAVFSFQMLPDDAGIARTASFQVGPDPDFEFRDEADKKNYRQMLDNTLARSLEGWCREICGGEDAPEPQLAGVTKCLTQGSLLPLRHISALAGTSFGEHANVSVSLSRRPDGTVRAEFLTPPDMRETRGQFRMSLDIAPDGATTVREFELTPPADILREREREARNVRADEAVVRAAPFLDMDEDNPSGLLSEMRGRALSLSPDAAVTPETVRFSGLETAIRKRVRQEARANEAPLTEAQIRGIRDAVLDAHFTGLNAVAARVPEAERPAFVRACLELGLVPDEALLPAMRQMAGAAASTFRAMLAARDGREARVMMDGLTTSLRSATIHDPAFAGKDAGFFLPAQMLAMRLGLMNLMGGDSPESVAQALARPGPFRDMLYDLAHEGETLEKNFVEQTHNLFKGGMSGIMSDGMLENTLNPYLIRERDLSLPRQREIFGEGTYVARGVDVARPDLAGLNQSLRRDMPALRAHVQTQAEVDLREGPVTGDGGHSRTASGLSQMFAGDFPRGGVFVNGRYYHPRDTGTTEQGFINLFPDSRTAGLLSNLAGQNLPGLFMEAMSRQPRDSGSAKIAWEVFANPTMMAMEAGQPTTEAQLRNMNIRIDALDADQGRYRITAFRNCGSSDPNSALERFMFEVSVEVNLGAPGADPPPDPVVEDVRLDMLLRGREVAPGDT